MKTLVLRILFTATALMGLPTSGLAVPVLWTLNGVTFTDGGTASGSFFYDADTNTYSAVSITTTTGSVMTGATFAFVYPGSYPTGFLALTVPSGSNQNQGLPGFELLFLKALTDAGGTVLLAPGSSQYTCNSPNCDTYTLPLRNTSAGSVVAAAQPSPPSGCALAAVPQQLPADGGAVSLTVSCTSGGAPTSYTWSGPGVNQGAGASQVVNVTTTSTFTVVAANAAGSAPAASVTVTVAPSCTIVYTVDIPGVLIGTITTDCTIGPLTQKNILAWNLTATVANPSGGPPLTFYFNSASPSTGTEVVCGDGGCGVASAETLTFPGASLLELGIITSPARHLIQFSSREVDIVDPTLAGNPGAGVEPPATFSNQPIPDLNQHGLTGSWYEMAKSGQGLEFEIFPNQATGTGSAFVSWFTFDTVAGGESAQRWYTALGPVVTGQPNAMLTIYQNTGGNFNAPPATASQPVGTATLSITTCINGHISYSFSDGTGRTGDIALARLLQSVTCSTTTSYSTNPDFALSGNWYGGPATSGQGFTIEVNPMSSYLFVAWYTYEPSGVGAGAAGQRWYTAQASFTAGMRSIPVKIYETTGGIFNTSTPAGQQTTAVGTGTLAFQSCTAATFSYTFTAGSNSGLSGTINLSRVGPVPPGCTS